MEKNYAFEIRVPATSANFGVCFDFAGVEIPDLYNTVYASPSDQLKITVEGCSAGHIPCDKNNVIYKAYARTFEFAQRPLRQVEMHCVNRIPLNRGLGSSSAAILSGIYLANRMMDDCLSKDQLFQIASAMEGHPDNVAPALYGGIVLSVKVEGEYRIQRLYPGGKLFAALVVPEIMLPTAKARAVLPKLYSRADVVAAASMAAMAIDALQKGDFALMGKLITQDVIHQPYRKSLIPGYDDAVAAAMENGAYGAGISGAGSTLIAFCPDRETAQTVGNAMQESFERKGIGASSFVSELSRERA